MFNMIITIVTMAHCHYKSDCLIFYHLSKVERRVKWHQKEIVKAQCSVMNPSIHLDKWKE